MGASSASTQATYGLAEWSRSFQGTTGRGNLTETPTGRTGRSSEQQPGQRRSERAIGHTSTTTGTRATSAAGGRQQDLSHPGRRAATHRTLGTVLETETEPSSISSTSSTPRGGHRVLDPLSPVQSDAEAGPSDAAADRQELAKMQRMRAQVPGEHASFMASRKRPGGAGAGARAARRSGAAIGQLGRRAGGPAERAGARTRPLPNFGR